MPCCEKCEQQDSATFKMLHHKKVGEYIGKVTFHFEDIGRCSKHITEKAKNLDMGCCQDPGASRHLWRKNHFPGPRNTQTPLDKEDPEAPRHLWRKRTKEHPDTTGPRGPRSTQTPLEEESLPRTKEHSDTIGPRVSRITQTPLDQETFHCPAFEVEIGQSQSKSTYNNIKDKNSPESSPPPTPRPEHCNVDKAEENDLKNSQVKMLEEAFEGKMKNTFKEIEEKNKNGRNK
ncbi:hypothetical protein STEG23_024650 [Scotinomys teguina]